MVTSPTLCVTRTVKGGMSLEAAGSQGEPHGGLRHSLTVTKGVLAGLAVRQTASAPCPHGVSSRVQERSPGQVLVSQLFGARCSWGDPLSGPRLPAATFRARACEPSARCSTVGLRSHSHHTSTVGTRRCPRGWRDGCTARPQTPTKEAGSHLTSQDQKTLGNRGSVQMNGPLGT